MRGKKAVDKEQESKEIRLSNSPLDWGRGRRAMSLGLKRNKQNLGNSGAEDNASRRPLGEALGVCIQEAVVCTS